VPAIEFAKTVLPGLDAVTVAVTGGASGIGRAAAVLAAQSGARVVAGDLNDELLADLDAEAKARGLSIEGVHLDVSDADSVAEFVAAADARSDLFGVVNSAGISPDSPGLDMPLSLWHKVLDVNLTGTFLVCQLSGRAMVHHGRGGSIVNIGSAVGTSGSAVLPHYAASKGGVVSLTRSFAKELGPHDIRVNCVSPGGAVNTPLMWSRVTEEYVQQRVAGLPLARLGQPEDLAYCIGFLLSGLSAWITGQNIQVNGGSLMT
jgi:NAD(P)-dependent dehydrogenase (short-subunit alcohol dehydrogenase family)